MIKTKMKALLLCGLLCIALLLSACGTNLYAITQYILINKLPRGLYVEEIAGRGSLLVKDGSNGSMSFRIEWSGSYASRACWEMSGQYDADKNAYIYDDCVCIETTYDEQGRGSDKVIYTHGTGSFTYADKKFYWTDDMEPERGEAVFVFEQSLAEYERIHADDADQSAAPTPSTQPVTPSPAPSASPSPTPNVPPTITKHPTDETLNAGGSCKFVAKYENAIWARWHFVSPDGKMDFQYDAINTQFPGLVVVRGDYSDMTLQNVPYEMNGWRVYCRYSNEVGAVDTKTALITVLPAPAPTATPTPTQQPTPTEEPTPTLGPVVNEWKDTDSVIEATYGAGFNFTPPLEQTIPSPLQLKGYRYRIGTLEADYADENGTVQMIIRKSNTDSGKDLSGDYNSYSSSWDITLKGLSVHCLGNGETVNTCWFDGGGFHYSISFYMGKEGEGLTPDQINSIVNSMQ